MGELILKENNDKYDIQLGMSLELAKKNSLEAQRLATDCSQLLSQSSDRLKYLQGEGYFQRLCDRLTGKKLQMDAANHEDMYRLQEMSFRYLELIDKSNLMAMDSIVTIKNQLNYIIADNVDTKKAITNLASKIKVKVDSLERRIDRLETITSIHGWLLTIDEYDYVNLYPKNIRLLSVIKDFRYLKNKDWTVNDFRCLKSALRKVSIVPDETTTLRDFVDSIAKDNYPDKYSEIINDLLLLEDVDVKRVKNELSLPLLSAMYQFAGQYLNDANVIQRLVKLQPDIHPRETAANLIIQFLDEGHINMDSEVEYQHLAMELLTGVNMARYFASKTGFICANQDCIIAKQKKHFIAPGYCVECGELLELDESEADKRL